MKKTAAKEKNHKASSIADGAISDVDLEGNPEEEHTVSELDPEILKVFVKPKKPKAAIDATDYIPELERGDIDEEFGSDAGGI